VGCPRPRVRCNIAWGLSSLWHLVERGMGVGGALAVLVVEAARWRRLPRGIGRGLGFGVLRLGGGLARGGRGRAGVGPLCRGRSLPGLVGQDVGALGGEGWAGSREKGRASSQMEALAGTDASSLPAGVLPRCHIGGAWCPVLPSVLALWGVPREKPIEVGKHGDWVSSAARVIPAPSTLCGVGS